MWKPKILFIQSVTWAPIPMRPSLRHSIAYLYPCPTWPRTQLSGTYGNVQTYKKYRPVKVLLCSKFWLPFSFQLWKVEVIYTSLAKFQAKIPMGRPIIFNVKFRFVLPPLLDFKSGWEPHKDLELVGTRGMWRHTHIMARFHGQAKKQAILFEFTGAKGQLHSRDVFEITPGEEKRSRLADRKCILSRKASHLHIIKVDRTSWWCSYPKLQQNKIISTKLSRE